MTDFGLWIDDSWRLIRNDNYWITLKRLGVRTADLMIDSSDLAWSPQYTDQQLELICELGRDHDIEIVFTGWPAPRRSVIDPMLADLDRYARFGTSAIDLDTEHLWRTSYLDGSYKTLRAAGEALIDGLHKIRDKHDVRIELTTHTGHSEATERAVLTPYVDRLYWQIYTTRHDWRGEDVAFDSRQGPGRRQTDAIETIRRRCPWIASGEVELCVGQALWDQRWPGVKIDYALNNAYHASVSAGIRSHRGWSSKWVAGVKSGSLAQQEIARWVQRQFGS